MSNNSDRQASTPLAGAPKQDSRKPASVGKRNGQFTFSLNLGAALRRDEDWWS